MLLGREVSHAHRSCVALTQAYDPKKRTGRWQYEDTAASCHNLRPLPGTAKSFCACQEKLGEGGLAVVYRARDAVAPVAGLWPRFLLMAVSAEVSGPLGEVAIKVSKFKNLAAVSWFKSRYPRDSESGAGCPRARSQIKIGTSMRFIAKRSGQSSVCTTPQTRATMRQAGRGPWPSSCQGYRCLSSLTEGAGLFARYLEDHTGALAHSGPGAVSFLLARLCCTRRWGLRCDEAGRRNSQHLLIPTERSSRVPESISMWLTWCAVSHMCNGDLMWNLGVS